MYILDADLFSQIPENTCFHMTDLADLLIKNKQQVGMYPISEDDFLDMGELEEMKRMEQKLAQNERWDLATDNRMRADWRQVFEPRF